jgi:hypothetical protein
MIPCRIGLVAWARDSNKNCWLNLGEIFDQKIRKDLSALYSLHQDLRYLTPFRTTATGLPDSIEDIMSLQKRYRLTRGVRGNGLQSFGLVKFDAPRLYDLSCMIPLFTDSVPRASFTQGDFLMKFYILFPYADPVIRGTILDHCLAVSRSSRIFFYIMGNRQGQNAVPTYKLYQRYLRHCGVSSDDITVSQYDTFPDCIIEAINMINFVRPEEKQIFIGVSTEDMNRVMSHIRLARDLGVINQRISLVCN